MDSIIEFAKETYILSIACGAISVFITVFAGWALLKAVQTALLSEDSDDE
jgi:hypothetical protein